jgi:mannose-6-phosphate isomerase
MQLLDNPIRPYPWGSPTAIPELLGVPPTGEPHAELWIGAHPVSPSFLSGGERSLVDLISADPAGELGESCRSTFGPRLPFLLKVLAAAAPLSLQAHPDDAQARAGFDAEEAAGVLLEAPERNYKDPYAKPEMICALTPLEALIGFRPVAQTLDVAERLGLAALEPMLAQLRERPDADGVRTAFTMVMTAPSDARRTMVEAVLDACRGSDLPVARLLARLGESHAEDPGVVAALLLNHVHLAPGEAVYLPPGNLHAYIEGVGVEILANSDNVLRGGLTGKHVDVPELLHVLDFTPQSPDIRTASSDGSFATPAREFRLARHDVAAGEETLLPPAGPQLLLCVDGHVVASSELGKVELTRGTSAYAGAAEGAVTLAGAGTVFRATAGVT